MMKTKNTLWLAIMLTVFTMATTSFINTEEKKIKLAGTSWVAERTMFVADVGNEKITVTIHFVSDKEVTITHNYFTPSHPSMRMMPDGTVPVNPAKSTTHEEKGTYKVKKKTITILTEDGSTYKFKYAKDSLELMPDTLSSSLGMFSFKKCE